jgi:hypothetical protein
MRHGLGGLPIVAKIDPSQQSINVLRATFGWISSCRDRLSYLLAAFPLSHDIDQDL